MSDKYEPPQPTIKDHAHAVTRAVLGSVPGYGAAAAELFQMVVVPSLDKRRVEWMNEVAEALRTLEEKYDRLIEDLASNEKFVDVLLQASSAAMRTSHEEKHTALRNAVLNSALPNPPDESRQQMFIQWVDSLTVWHLRILRLLADPLQWFQEEKRQPPRYVTMSSLSGLITDAYPELKNQRDLYDLIGKDLDNSGLIEIDNFHTTMSPSGAFERRASELGQQFIRFVTAPAE